jgi:thioredoxin reductase (NADPH)
MPEHVIIIGSGPAGWAAAIYAARANLHPLVLEGAETEENRVAGTLPLGQLNLTTEVENYPGFPAGLLHGYIRSAVDGDRVSTYLEPLHEHRHAVTGPELMNLMRQQAINFGTRIITDDIVEVDLGRRPFQLKTLEGKSHEAHTIIIATGARANYLGLPSEERFKNRGVSACAVCDGALPRFRNKPLVVVGGGDSAVEEATYLTKFASVVYMIHRRKDFRASKIMQQRVWSNPKITQLEAQVDEVIGDEKHGVTGVRIKPDVANVRRPDGSWMSFKEWVHETEQRQFTHDLIASGLFLAIGHTPNTDFLKGQLKLNEKGYIQYTTLMRTFTSVEGVYAAGDVADDYYRQAVTSAGTGCMAALDAERYLAAKGL